MEELYGFDRSLLVAGFLPSTVKLHSFLYELFDTAQMEQFGESLFLN